MQIPGPQHKSRLPIPSPVPWTLLPCPVHLPPSPLPTAFCGLAVPPQWQISGHTQVPIDCLQQRPEVNVRKARGVRHICFPSHNWFLAPCLPLLITNHLPAKPNLPLQIPKSCLLPSSDAVQKVTVFSLTFISCLSHQIPSRVYTSLFS